jgi:hypothetical protein
MPTATNPTFRDEAEASRRAFSKVRAARRSALSLARLIAVFGAVQYAV